MEHDVHESTNNDVFAAIKLKRTRKDEAVKFLLYCCGIDVVEKYATINESDPSKLEFCVPMEDLINGVTQYAMRMKLCHGFEFICIDTVLSNLLHPDTRHEFSRERIMLSAEEFSALIMWLFDEEKINNLE